MTPSEVRERAKFVQLGKTYTMQSGLQAIVTSYTNCENVQVKFMESGFEVKTSVSVLRKGLVKDKSLPSVQGAGCLDGLPTHANGIMRKDYSVWSGILERCYSPRFQKEGSAYNGCTVSDNFKSFAFFSNWCKAQVGFGENGFAIDKDILSNCQKHYSEDTCLFVPQEVNNLFKNTKSCRGKFPKGVTKIGTRFYSRYKRFGESVHLGAHATPEEAFETYCKAMTLYVQEIAEKWKEQIDARAYTALLNYKINITD